MPRFKTLLSKYFLWMFVALFSLGQQPTVLAQASSASLTVSITDTTGAVIPDASVVIRNTDTNQEQRSTSGKSGSTSFSFLKPSHYALFVSKQSFADIAIDNITLNVGDDKHLQLILKVGSAQQSITVDGSGLTINTTDGSVSTVVDRNFVANMPLNGRSFQDLIQLTPGVTTTSPQTSSSVGVAGEFSVNGQRTESNAYTVDGVNANTSGYIDGRASAGTSGSVAAATALGTTQSLVSVDDLQEFRVQSSSYSAEYGLSPGGQLAFETRSGTNDVHGTLFDYLRNDALDANNWFNDTTTPITRKTAERQNDFGGTLGGPVRIPKLYDGKNKSFIFFSYEGLRLTEPQAALTTYVPSMSLRQAAPAILQPLLNAFPVPTGTALPNGLAPFAEAYSLPSSLNSTSIRFDQQLTSKIKLFFRFSDTQSATESRYDNGLSEIDTTRQSNYTNTLGITSELSEKIANDFRINYTASTGSSSSAFDSFGGATPVTFLQLQGIDAATHPDASAGFGLYFAGYDEALTQDRATQPQHASNVNDSTSISYGRQTLKVGATFRRISSRLAPSSPNVTSIFDSDTGVLANISEAGIVDVTSTSYPAYSNFAIYIQDEVKASHRLNLSLGLRWEVNPPPSSTSQALPYIVQGNLGDPSSLNLAPTGTRFWKTTYYNFAPRLGIAYIAHQEPGRETVLRAGGGVFFDSGQQTSTQAFGNSVGQNSEGLYFGSSYPLAPAQVNLSIANPPIAPYNAQAYYFPTRLQLPYTLQWNVSVEQALGRSQTLTISYVGSNGRRLLSQQDISPATGDFSSYGIVQETSGTTSSYNALQVKFQRTLSRGLQVLGSYNWAHSIDFGSQDTDFAQIRGNSDYDLRNNFNLAATYDFPTTHSGALIGTLTHHWSLDTRLTARGAFPVILDGNQITLPNGQSAYQGLNLVPNVPVYLHVQGIPGNRQINPAAFAVPPSNAYGNAPRNFVRGFGMNQLDLAVRRSFPIVDRLNLQFRAEMFNILNHPDFGYIYPYYGGVQFGQATQTLNESLGTLSPLYQQGGPRSMQMSLRLQF
ncbi:hypothetical protein HNQ77_001664 [Silvibacterium bohemicum]|uniref:TonB-dependent receptor plug domain-containing protein n=1 Tax=Silvibacterium bohemicum TaxID=1577686 RepID=A0A841JT93_9BACT|nr:carboxypeptidase regulatory-like domain-containing protein [Silvibacterium bohemicum]MBB6143715.1 hypothetical protein [Silvibacterium bohemicum]